MAPEVRSDSVFPLKDPVDSLAFDVGQTEDSRGQVTGEMEFCDQQEQLEPGHVWYWGAALLTNLYRGAVWWKAMNLDHVNYMGRT